MDEADLTFSYGFEEDMKKLLPFLPQIFQAFLMSATLSEDVLSLKKLILHNPVSARGRFIFSICTYFMYESLSIGNSQVRGVRSTLS